MWSSEMSFGSSLLSLRFLYPFSSTVQCTYSNIEFAFREHGFKLRLTRSDSKLALVAAHWNVEIWKISSTSSPINAYSTLVKRSRKVPVSHVHFGFNGELPSIRLPSSEQNWCSEPVSHAHFGFSALGAFTFERFSCYYDSISAITSPKTAQQKWI